MSRWTNWMCRNAQTGAWLQVSFSKDLQYHYLLGLLGLTDKQAPAWLR
jgi:hypothetical protein